MSARQDGVPFADLHAQYASIRTEIDTAIADVIRTSAFVRGPFVERFEAEFAAATGSAHCVSCANGTDSLYIAMKSLDVKPGDEVVVPANSWISTSETVTQAGATVVFCDIDAQTYTLDPVKLVEKITPRTVGVIPVHLFGQPADMDPIMDIARKNKLWVIEDCAQSHLALYKGKMVGSYGQAASYSFYPGKNLGAMGDAGALTTPDARLAERMAMFARHGGLKKGDHLIEGINSRLDGLQGAILSVKLKHLPAWTRTRQQLAQIYSRALAKHPGVTTPFAQADRQHVYHLYVIQHERRDALVAHLAVEGIQTVINYPVALPFLPAYARFAHKPRDFPITHQAQSRILSIPIFPEMSESQVRIVVDSIGRFCEAAR